MSSPSKDLTPDQMKSADNKADAYAIIVVFVCMVLGAVHFISGG